MHIIPLKHYKDYGGRFGYDQYIFYLSHVRFCDEAGRGSAKKREEGGGSKRSPVVAVRPPLPLPASSFLHFGATPFLFLSRPNKEGKGLLFVLPNHNIHSVSKFHINHIVILCDLLGSMNFSYWIVVF